MINTIKTIFSVTSTQSANSFIYFLKKIPIIKKIISDDIYRETSLKLVLAFIATSLKSILCIVGKFVYVFLALILPVVLTLGKNLPVEQIFKYSVHILFCLNLGIGVLISCDPLTNSTDKFLCVKMFGIDSKQYNLASILYKQVFNFLVFLPVLIIGCVVAHQPFYYGILLAALITFAKVAGIALHFIIFEKFGKKIVAKIWFVIISVVPFLVLAIIPIIFKITPNYVNSINLFAGFLIGFLVFLLSVNYISKYKLHQKLLNYILKRDEMVLLKAGIENEAMFSAVKLKEKDFQGETFKSKKINALKGYNLLNAIFFKHHERLLTKPIAIHTAIIFGVGIIILIIGCFFEANILKRFSDLFSRLNLFVFIMYVISIGDKFTKALYFNCDKSLLHYSFYRKKDVILQNFWIRLKKVVPLNLIPAIGICVCVMGIFFIGKQPLNWNDFCLFSVAIMCLSVFFSIHHLFMYYIFQPYNDSLNMKNPFFQIINSSVYVVCFVLLQIEVVPSGFTFVVIISTVIYIIAALLVVLKLAPKTFKIK
ncbi:MAG: hypothetical protein RSA79_02230 [Oscillospiraceae bacterium]